MVKLFICTGENFINGYGVGFCGTVKTLKDWILTLFTQNNALEFFKGDTEQEILEYIYKNTGKRLERNK